MLSDLLFPETIYVSPPVPNTAPTSSWSNINDTDNINGIAGISKLSPNSYACLQELCQRYASLFHIKICFQGNTAYATPDTIVLPQFTRCSPMQLHLHAGYLAHEAGHICFSDFSLYQQLHLQAALSTNIIDASSATLSHAMATPALASSTIVCNNNVSPNHKEPFDSQQVLLTLVNILEDCRVDYLMSQSHPEVFSCLQFLNKSLYYRHLKLVPFLYRYHKLQLLFSYLLFVGHDLLLHYQWSSALRYLYERELSTLIDQATLKLLSKNMSKLSTCRHTQDVLELSQILENILHWPHAFVPNLQRFALHHQLTSSFDLNHCAQLAQHYGQNFTPPVLNPRPREQQVQSYAHLQQVVAQAFSASASASTSTSTLALTAETSPVAVTHAQDTTPATLTAPVPAMLLQQESTTSWSQLLMRARLNPHLFTPKLQDFDFATLPPELCADGMDLSLRQYEHWQQHQQWLSSPQSLGTALWHHDLQRRESILREQFLLKDCPTNVLPTIDPHAYCRDENGLVQPCDYTLLWLCASYCYQEHYEALSTQVKKQLQSPHSPLSRYLMSAQPHELSCQVAPQKSEKIELSSLIGPLSGINGEQLSTLLKQCCTEYLLSPASQQALENLVHHWRNLPTAKLIADEHHKQQCTTHLAQNFHAAPTYADLLHTHYQWQRRCLEELDTNRRDPLQDYSYTMARQSLPHQSQFVLSDLNNTTAAAFASPANSPEATTSLSQLSLQQPPLQVTAPAPSATTNARPTASLLSKATPQQTPPAMSPTPHIMHTWIQQVKDTLKPYLAPLMAMMQDYSKRQAQSPCPSANHTLNNDKASSAPDCASPTAFRNATTNTQANLSANKSLNADNSLALPPLLATAHTALHLVVDLSISSWSTDALTTATTAKTTPMAMTLPPLVALANSLALAQALLNNTMSGLCTLISYTRFELDSPICRSLGDGSHIASSHPANSNHANSHLDSGHHNGPHGHDATGNYFAQDPHSTPVASYGFVSNSSTYSHCPNHSEENDTDSSLLTILSPHHDLNTHATDFYQVPHKPCALNKALWQALHKLLPSTAPRQILVLLTTQEPPRYKPYPTLSELLTELSIEFYVIGAGLSAQSAWSRLCTNYYPLTHEQQLPQLLTALNTALWSPRKAGQAPMPTTATKQPTVAAPTERETAIANTEAPPCREGQSA